MVISLCLIKHGNFKKKKKKHKKCGCLFHFQLYLSTSWIERYKKKEISHVNFIYKRCLRWLDATRTTSMIIYDKCK